MQERIAFHNDRWVDASALSFSIDDLGVTQAAMIVERIRAYCGTLFALNLHLERWDHSAAELSLSSLRDVEWIKSRIDELLDRNQQWISEQEEFGLLMLGTAGRLSEGVRKPTLILDLYSLPQSDIDRLRTEGSPLWITDVQQPSAACWPRSIKVRSRLHYYLADGQAAAECPGALGVLVDQDGSITETGIANVIAVEGGCLVSPPSDQILAGVSLAVVRRLAEQLGIEFQDSRVFPSRLLAADEVLLTGTRCGIWFARSVNGRAFSAGPVYQRLRRAFDDLIRGELRLEGDR